LIKGAEFCLDVVNSEADVMHPFSVLGDPACERMAGVEGLN
jgi:hypothetical protein